MMDKGFHRVRPLHGGIEAWIAAGHPAVGDSEDVTK
jgi:rhodanese-related sulfurtransferase